MHYYTRFVTSRLLASMLVINVSACGWVDSTGVQGSTVAAALRNAQPVGIIEGTPLTAALAGDGANQRNWHWQLDDTDVRKQCASISGFEEQLSVASLADACSQASECQVSIEESAGEDNATLFTLTMPTLRAPVALNYRLSSTLDDGATIERQQFLCGLSVNEAPIATDDSYLVMADDFLIVNPSDGNNLLANDQDDDDIRNSTLKVTGIARAPIHASRFSFDDSGGFTYAVDASVLANTIGDREDSFVYTISDGLHETQATVFIRIVSSNTTPAGLQRLPDLTVQAAAESDKPELLQFDLSQYFSDADGDALIFTIARDQLPASGNISLSLDGQLHTQAMLVDIGSYWLDMQISDGIDMISDTFILKITEPDQTIRNHSPAAMDISNQVVRNRFSYDVSGFFSDSDGDKLSFSATGLPDAVSISSAGIISGTANRDNRGKWRIRVTADDGNGGTVTDRFQLQIK